MRSPDWGQGMGETGQPAFSAMNSGATTRPSSCCGRDGRHCSCDPHDSHPHGSDRRGRARRAGSGGRGATHHTPPAAKASYKQLSNENTLSRWAYTNLTSKIKKPVEQGTHDGQAALQHRGRPARDLPGASVVHAAKGEEWVQIRIPGRPNGRKGWVPREGLGEFHVVKTHLTISRRR